jgi:leucyl-tRNA synthetase
MLKNIDKSRAIMTSKNVMVLPMIVYTTGYLHLGHCRSYVACDLFHRWFKSIGCNSICPFGYDAHGLPTELKAREEGLNPVK